MSEIHADPLIGQTCQFHLPAQGRPKAFAALIVEVRSSGEGRVLVDLQVADKAGGWSFKAGIPWADAPAPGAATRPLPGMSMAEQQAADKAARLAVERQVADATAEAEIESLLAEPEPEPEESIPPPGKVRRQRADR